MSISFVRTIPCIEIQLPSGLRLHDAAAMLTAKFEQWPWDWFDGIPIADPDMIADADVDVAFSGVRARTPVNRELFRSRVRERGASISGFLRALPADIGIEDIDLDRIREPIIGLYDCLTGMRGAKLANATKLTYRNRPLLLPVLDSALDSYYRYSTSIRDEARFLELRNMGWGKYAFALLELFRDDLCAVRADVDRVRVAIAGQPFAAASHARILESLIWYYYCGR